MGPIPIDYVELLSNFCNTVPLEAGSPKPEDWTYAVVNSLRKLCPAGYTFWGSCKSESGEKYKAWMCDAVWYQRDRHNIGLAVESEWAASWSQRPDKLSHILYDFEKLMIVKAPLKLMVVESDEKFTRDVITQGLVDHLRTSDQNIARERYLLVDFSEGCHYSYELQIPANPKEYEAYRFEPVAEVTGYDPVYWLSTQRKSARKIPPPCPQTVAS